MMYQVGRAEHPEPDDEKFETEAEALKHAQREAYGDYVIAVWRWNSEDYADVVCLIYGGEVYTT